MKVLYVGDVHAKPKIIEIVKKVQEKHKFDKIVFVGDYVDDWSVVPQDNIDILEKILEFKRDNMDLVTLLLGNHELSYLGHPCSGHKKSFETQELLRKNIKCFDLVHQVDRVVATHGGFIYNWSELVKTKFGSFFPHLDLNDKLHSLDDDLLEYLSIASYTSGGSSDCASPLWARPDDHKRYAMIDEPGLEETIQVVGHTPIQYPIETCMAYNIYYVDTFSSFRDGRSIGCQDLLVYDTCYEAFSYLEPYNDYEEIKYGVKGEVKYD